MSRLKGQGKIDEFVFVLMAGLIIIIIMLFAWGVPSSTQIPTVSPDSISLSIKKGSHESILLEINVSSTNVDLIPKGTIASWIEFSDNGFESEGLSNVEVTFRVPYGTDERKYYGTIVVESAEGGEVNIPVTITVTDISVTEPTELSRTIYIGDFSVSYAEGTDIVLTERNIEVRKGISENRKTTMSASITRNMDMITGGSIIIYLEYTNYEGNLIVKFNNQVLYDQKVYPGEIVIPIEESLIRSYNTIEISTSSPGWKFWTSSIYRIDKFEFNIDYYGNVEKEEMFNVYRNELLKFKQGRIEFYVNSYEGDGKLIVKINDYVVHEERRRGPFQLIFYDVDVGLIKGVNTISFETEPGTIYDVENVRIILIHEA